MSAKIIAIANQKGGVGKTVTAVNFATGLAEQNKKVLLVDFDPQGNASSYLNYDSSKNKLSIVDLMDIVLKQDCIEYSTEHTWYTESDKQLMHQLKEEMSQAIVCDENNRVDLLPANITLSGAEMTLISSVYRNQALKIILSYYVPDYDYIIIDCSPTLGIMLVNALVAANEVIIPVQTEEFAIDGIVQMLQTVQNVRRAENHNLKIAGFLLTMVQPNVIEYGEIKEGMEQQFGNLMYTTMISRSVQVPRSTKEHIPIIQQDHKIGKQYRDFTKEYLNRQGV